MWDNWFSAFVREEMLDVQNAQQELGEIQALSARCCNCWESAAATYDDLNYPIRSGEGIE